MFKMIKFIFHDRHFKFYKSVEADLSFEMKNRIFNILLCASSIGHLEGKKVMIGHFSCM